LYVDIFNTDKKYSIIYADPPWSYNDKKCNGACELHYQTMKIDDICALPVERIAEKDCVLFLWATYPMMREALRLIEAWGFEYKTIGFQWIKQNRSGKGWFFGLGRWTRGNTEPCFIATRGKPKRVSASVSQLIEWPLGRHSAKPPIVRKKIMELMGGGEAIELFARQSAPGWDCWGNEAPDEEAEVLPDNAAGNDDGQLSFFDYFEAQEG
jgi:site-specific DNA-methyltransferase (adenine-specific)